MAKKKVEETVEELCLPIANRLGLNLIDVEYKKEGSNYVLRIIIDKPQGIVIEDCENLSRELDEKLDELDPIQNAYSLEVQSPGERILVHEREYEYFKDRDVEVKFYEPLEGKKVFEGILKGLKDGNVTIQTEKGEDAQFPMDKIAHVRLKIKL
ncbi:ribosome maturation factor RimP [Oxobacter pfennigii]|uniref:Ribosome maturation factor RimP n=1 Tax=Oxobacter pfennigii TaxID=36849 RepID=A0A0P8W5H5_9CLOT|nr:ribosome maturation factor RimP [Oxobacter pfennigii]KPU43906.1 ribosome maturation factor RimP [Oxobacter pfennigii]